MVTVAKKITLEEFLQLPETNPASEYIQGKIIQKPMPKGRHSRLQSKLCTVINQVVETEKIAYAFTELRCTFGGISIVPDVAIFQWKNIPFTANGAIPDDFKLAPNWTIEIISPAQKANQVIGNILHCLSFGCSLGWLIDPDDDSVLVFSPGKQPALIQGENNLPVLEEIELNLTVNQLFDWLKMRG